MEARRLYFSISIALCGVVLSLTSIATFSSLFVGRDPRLFGFFGIWFLSLPFVVVFSILAARYFPRYMRSTSYPEYFVRYCGIVTAVTVVSIGLACGLAELVAPAPVAVAFNQCVHPTPGFAARS